MIKKTFFVYICIIILFLSLIVTSVAIDVNNEESIGLVENEFDLSYANSFIHNNILFNSDYSIIQSEDNAYSTYNIIGDTDDRIEIEDTEIYPHSAIVLLEITWSLTEPVHYATGFMVSKNVAVTSAHVLYKSDEGWPLSVKVYPGKNGDGLFSNPYSSSFASKSGVSSDWYEAISNKDYDTALKHDWGAVKLILPLGKQTGTIEFKEPTDADLLGTPIKLCGYPEINNTTTYKQYEMSGNILRFTDNYIFYHIDTSDGQSGSPILTENNIAYGIHSGYSENSFSNRAFRINSNFVYHINETIERYD